MNRANVILVIVLALLAGVYLATKPRPGRKEVASSAPRLYPELNKEAADRIVVEGGWPDTRYVIERSGSDWVLASAGGYPVKRENVDKILDAAWNIQRDNVVGTSEALRRQTRTDEKGRLVRIWRGESPMAEFRIGKNPPSNYDEFFLRKEGADEIYRSRTVLSEDKDKAVDLRDPFSSGARGFGWNNYILLRNNTWIDDKVWELGDAETQEIVLKRADGEIGITRKGQAEWEILKPEAAPADTDAVNGMADGVRHLTCVDVLGKLTEVGAQYGLDKPEITLHLTLKKKIEKKEEPKKEGEGEKKEGEEKPGEKKEGEEKPAEPPKEEYVTIHRVLSVGKLLQRADDISEETGEVTKKDFYPIAIGGDFDDEQDKKRSDYVFLVRDYSITSLKKTLADLKQKPKEEPPKEGETKEGEATPGEKPAEEKPAEKPPEPPKEGDAPKEPPAPPEPPK